MPRVREHAGGHDHARLVVDHGLNRGSHCQARRVGSREVPDRDVPAREQAGVVGGRQLHAGVDLAARHRPLQLLRARVAAHLERLLGIEIGHELTRQRPALSPEHADADLVAAAERRAQQQDDQHRQDEQEEDVGPPAQQAPQLVRGYHESLHDATSLRERLNAMPPVTRAKSRIASTGPITAPAPAPPARFWMPRRNQACGVARLSSASAPPA